MTSTTLSTTNIMASSSSWAVVPAASTADFLDRCARASDRFFYPCNAKHREPKHCTYAFRRAEGDAIEVRVAECEYSEGGTGWRVWPCALLLSCWLAAQHEAELSLRGVRVLELGCGLGLPGLTAAALGAAEVVLSDCLPVLLRTVALSVEANAATSTVASSTCVALLDWDEEAPGSNATETYSTEQAIKSEQLLSLAASALAAEEAEVAPSYERLGPFERFGLLLASDVVYSMQHAEQLAAVVGGRLASAAGGSSAGGRFCAMVPVRSKEHTRCFLGGLLGRGLEVAVTRVDRPWVEGVTGTQRSSPLPNASEWTACTARNGRPFWHHARTNASVWTEPARAAAWRRAARTYGADTPLTEGEILFVDARLPAAAPMPAAAGAPEPSSHQALRDEPVGVS